MAECPEREQMSETDNFETILAEMDVVLKRTGAKFISVNIETKDGRLVTLTMQGASDEE